MLGAPWGLGWLTRVFSPDREGESYSRAPLDVPFVMGLCWWRPCRDKTTAGHRPSRRCAILLPRWTGFRPVVKFSVLALLCLVGGLAAQAGPPNGPRVIDPRWHALRGATLIPAPGEKIDNATIVLRDGVIVSAGAGTEPPAGARVWDCSGLWVYAGLIEPYLPVDVPSPDTDAAHAHWNSNVMPQRSGARWRRRR